MTKIYMTMPQPGETITEGMIVSWLIKEGDVIKEGQAVAELETEKAVFEHESPFEGKILKILHPAETRVKVAQPIALMEVAADKAQHYIMLGIGKEVDESDSVEAGSPRPQSDVPAGRGNPAPTAPTVRVDSPSAVAITSDEIKNLGDLKMAPFVRRVALEAGVSKDVLVGLAKDHPELRVTKEAILSVLDPNFAAVERSSTPAERRNNVGAIHESPVQKNRLGSTAEYDVQPFSPIRMRIADNMAMSKQKIPHAHTGLTMDVSKVVSFRNLHKDAFKKKHGTNLNYLTLFAPAILNAIRKVPTVNASFNDEGAKPEIRLYNKINLGVAVGSEAGLVIPVVKDADGKDLKTFNADLSDKIERSANKKLKPDDFMGSTIIFNNFGFFGITYGVQIIQYPLAATLGMGVIEKRPVVIGDAIAIRDVADLFIAFDHRIIDGREAGTFLMEVKKAVENFKMTPSDLGL